MNIEEPRRLNVDQARDRVLTALRIRWPDVLFQVNESATIAREFGWVFTRRRRRRRRLQGPLHLEPDGQVQARARGGSVGRH